MSSLLYMFIFVKPVFMLLSEGFKPVLTPAGERRGDAPAHALALIGAGNLLESPPWSWSSRRSELAPGGAGVEVVDGTGGAAMLAVKDVA
jgi:hypothetical protein